MGIIALYFLKLRRRPVRVPSTILWRKSLEDLHVNSLFQRLQAQSPAVPAASGGGACDARPGRPANEGNGRPGAAIRAHDRLLGEHVGDRRRPDPAGEGQGAGQESRQRHGRRRPGDGDQVCRLGPGRLELHERSPHAGAAGSMRSSRSQARTSLRDGLQVAAGLANPSKQIGEGVVASSVVTPKLFIYTDGGFADVEGFSLGNLEPEVVVIGPPPPPYAPAPRRGRGDRYSKAQDAQPVGQRGDHGASNPPRRRQARDLSALRPGSQLPRHRGFHRSAALPAVDRQERRGNQARRRDRAQDPGRRATSRSSSTCPTPGSPRSRCG